MATTIKITRLDDDTLLIDTDGIDDKYTIDIPSFLNRTNIQLYELPTAIGESRTFIGPEEEYYLTPLGIAMAYLMQISDLNCGNASRVAKEGFDRTLKQIEEEQASKNH